MAALLMLTGPQKGRRVEIEGEVVVGRGSACEIELEDHKVSRRHARFVPHEGHFRVADLGSRNGTYVNGDRLEGSCALWPGDRIQIGDAAFLFEPPARAVLAEAAPADSVFRPLEEVVPAVGPLASALEAALALVAAPSEALGLRRIAETLVRGLDAQKAAVLLRGDDGLLIAALVGGTDVAVPRAWLEAAFERREIAWARQSLAVPLTSSAAGKLGLLYAERPEGFSEEAVRLCTALARLTAESIVAWRSRGAQPLDWVGHSRLFRRLTDQARRAAASDEPVVIWGEPGTGRLQTARFIHAHSTRAGASLVVVECGAAAEVVEAQLFGGAGAGSAAWRADAGSLVLRNVEKLPFGLMTRVARIAARRSAPAAGGGEDTVDPRWLATSRKSPQILAALGELNPELALLLHGLDLEVPPLRERPADIPALLEHFSRSSGSFSLSPLSTRALMETHWPGNLQELRLYVERLMLLHPSGEVPSHGFRENAPTRETTNLNERVAQVERETIVDALQKTGGKKFRAAQVLGISRPTLDKKIGDYGIEVVRRARLSR